MFQELFSDLLNQTIKEIFISLQLLIITNLIAEITNTFIVGGMVGHEKDEW